MSRRSRNTSLQPRPGFTLIELMIVVSLLAIIGTMLTTILVRQQRFHRAVANITDARARMRDIATILPTDLRGISTAGHDVLAISDTSMQFRAFIGAAVLCDYGSVTEVDIPPKELASGNVLTAWINAPDSNDIAYIYNEGVEAGNVDDSWSPYIIQSATDSVATAWCPSTNAPAYATAADNGALRYRIKLNGTPDQVRSPIGSPMRFAREVRYSVYLASDGQWYVGYQRCTPTGTFDGSLGTCAAREVLAGPVLPGTEDATSGLYFRYFDKGGTEMTALSATTPIASIEIGIHTTSESMLKANTKSGGSMTAGDSLKFRIGIRNRV